VREIRPWLGADQFDQLKRREFVTLLGGAAIAWPLAAHAQQAGKVVSGRLFGSSLNSPATMVPYEAFLAGLHELGSLARSGGNIAGVVYRQLELAAKQVELLT
jgi:putative ABC transport system substrate-binding protein